MAKDRVRGQYCYEYLADTTNCGDRYQNRERSPIVLNSFLIFPGEDLLKLNHFTHCFV